MRTLTRAHKSQAYRHTGTPGSRSWCARRTGLALLSYPFTFLPCQNAQVSPAFQLPPLSPSASSQQHLVPPKLLLHKVIVFATSKTAWGLTKFDLKGRCGQAGRAIAVCRRGNVNGEHDGFVAACDLAALSPHMRPPRHLCSVLVLGAL